jgi:hypothetical protein
MSYRERAERSSLGLAVSRWSGFRQHQPTRGRAPAAALPALGLAALALAALGTLDPSVLCMFPVLVLALAMAIRRYPGEGVLARLRTIHRRRPRVAGSLRHPRRHTVLLPRGGLLLAWALAVRPPPRRRLAAC